MQLHNMIAAQSCVLLVEPDGKVLVSGDASSVRADPASDPDRERPRAFFKPIGSLRDIVSVHLAWDSSEGAAALDKNGDVWVWGDDWENRFAQSSGNKLSPHKLPLPAKMSAIALGGSHLVALGNDARVYTIGVNPTYGGNDSGQLGNGDTTDSGAVVAIMGIDDAIAIAAGLDTTYFLRRDGTVWGCGSGGFGLLGPSANQSSLFDYDADKNINSRPIPIAGPKNITAIAAGYRFATAMDDSGNVWGWGMNDSGQLGPDEDDLKVVAPFRIPGLRNCKQIAAGYDFTLGLTDAERVVALGGNVYGTLGDNRNELVGELRTVQGLPAVNRIFAGHYNAFAIDKSGRAWGWGANAAEVGGFDPIKDPDDVQPTMIDPNRRPKPLSEIVQNGGMTIRLNKEQENDEVESSLQWSVNGKSVGAIAIDKNNASDVVSVDLPSGVHRIAVSGTIKFEGQPQRSVSGEGYIVVTGKQTAHTRFHTTRQRDGLLAAIREVHAEIEKIDAKLVPESVRLNTQSPLKAETIAQIEAALGYRLPADYREFLIQHGPFSLGPADAPYPQVAVYAPETTRTLEAWVTRGLNMVDKPVTNDWHSEANDYFDYFANLLSENGFRQRRTAWQNQPVLAATGLELFVADPAAQRCQQNAAAAHWIEFFETQVDEATGAESPMTWSTDPTCEPSLMNRLSEAVESSLRYGYADAGISFVGPSDDSPHVASGQIRLSDESDVDGDDVTDRNVIRVQMQFDGWGD
ncbi:MAG: SMI1/KNR4 family protein [Pirellulaceae bacterium]